MNDVGIIDQFLATFTAYIDSGFGLVGGEIGFLSTTLIAIDVTIAGLFWAWGADEDVFQRLIKKTLYIGFFAFLIGNFSSLAQILFQSFAGLGLQASGSTISLAEFMRPGSVAAVGLDAGEPLLNSASEMMGVTSFFANFVQIAVLMLAWAIVILAFFILSVQLFITLIEFKLVTLAGFVLLPFAFFGRTAFMAERVLGHIVSSGIKVLVLAVITGIGTGLFDQFIDALGGETPTAEQAMSIALASLALLGLGIFGPGVANGIVTGGPQLGAGAAAGTAIAAGAAMAGGVAGARLAAGAVASAAGSTAAGLARSAGAASASYSSGAQGKSGASGVAAGIGAMGKAAGSAAVSPLRRAADALKQNFEAGQAGSSSGGSGSGHAAGPPKWATSMRRKQSVAHGISTTAHTLRGGDGGGGGASIDLSGRE
ncbi:P-type conjugative transfer protein TrbL [Sphingobium sp.]|uniref:P-type conjugative transfer protein TrbL n=1 Tax=Sphingobium sp. TaxID=1912891 RepID=UPI003B3B3F73